MADSTTFPFDRCAGFTRGYLLACDWAGAAPSDAERRIPRLEVENVDDLYQRFRQLPRATRESLRASWPKREPRARLDETGVHPSWLTALLQSEPAATLLLALGELKPEVGREVLRTFWPRVKPTQGEPIEVRPLAPAWSGELRRWLYRRFPHAAPSALRQDALDRLALLDAQQLWLHAQDLGREELGEGEASMLGEAGLRILATRLAAHPREYAERIAHQMGTSLAERFLEARDEAAGPHTQPSAPGDSSREDSTRGESLQGKSQRGEPPRGEP